MKPYNLVENLLRRLSDVPMRIARAVAQLSEADKQMALSSREWSAAEILAHLRAADDIVAYRLHAILVRDNPPLPAYDERRWAETAGYVQADFESSLKTYTLRRIELVKMLRGVPMDDWKRCGDHEAKGTMSLLDVATSLVEHEEEHCRQLETTYRADKNG